MGKCFSVLHGGPTPYSEENESAAVTTNHGPPAAMTYKTSPPWTFAKLDAKRSEFWETAPAYGGDSEVWQVLAAYHAAEDPALGQAFLQAADVTATGEVVLKPCNDIGGQQASWSIFYDAKGYKYEVPVFCFHEPANLLRDKDEAADVSGNAVAAEVQEARGVENTV